MHATIENADDDKLHSLAISGNKYAFEELVRRYERKIRGYCFYMLKERTQAEDAAQEIFIKAYKALSSYQSDARFYTWLFRIAVNHCIDCTRKNKLRRWLTFFSTAKSEEVREYEQYASQYSNSASVEAAQILDKLLVQLSPENRSLMLLHEAYGMSHEELAHAQNCSIDAVKSRIKRSRQTLNTAYQRLGRDE